MMEMVVSFLSAVLFTVVISVGWGKELTETSYGRPVLGAIGFLIVIAGYSWQQQDAEVFRDLVFWFIVCCFPVMVGGVVSSLVEMHKAAERQRAQEIARHSVLEVGHDRA